MISLIGSNFPGRQAVVVNNQKNHLYLRVSAAIASFFLISTALYSFAAGWGLLSSAALLSCAILAEGLACTNLQLQQMAISQILQEKPQESVPVKEAEEKKINPCRIEIIERGEQLARFLKLLPTEKSVTLISDCDRFTNTNPADEHRIFVQGGVPTNGTFIWDGNVQMQGPGNVTHIEHLWRIVAENGLKGIVRIGEDKLKQGCCCPYTPRLGEPYQVDGSHFTIAFKKEHDTPIAPNITRRDYALFYNNEERLIAHFAHEGWPDHGITDCEALLKLIEELNSLDGPILVHCRGGVGRSGTLNTCRYIYQRYFEAKKEGLSSVEIDPAALVQELRSFRENSVQTPEQFEMILAFTDYLNERFEPI